MNLGLIVRSAFKVLRIELSTHKCIVLLTVCFLIAIRLFAGQTFVQGAIERAEIYSGTCLAQDPECSLTNQRTVKLEGEISSALNLFLHLLSTTLDEVPVITDSLKSTHIFNAVEQTMLFWVLQTLIFHPPRI